MFENAFIDTRLNRRADQMMQDMSHRKSAVVHQYCPTMKAQTGAYRFLGNPDVTEAEMSDAFGQQCAQQIQGRHILAIHDSSSMNFQAHAGRLSNQDPLIGPLETASQVGFFAHPVLAVDATSAFPLGYATVHLWSRPWHTEPATEWEKKTRPFEVKESFRWVDTVQRSASVLAEAEHVTVIADRESDIFEVFAQVPDATTDVLIRVAHNRRMHEEPGKLLDALAAAPCQGRYTLDITATPTRQARTAIMEVRWRSVMLHRPATASKDLPQTVTLWALETRETSGSVPAGEPPICWRLLTTHALDSFETVLTVIHWYQWRW
ncbi:MAG: IS4 family transposase, partial [Planctomycetes bacterium]|nr:IS4 family transposase [Planctomycetota bacterium]